MIVIVIAVVVVIVVVVGLIFPLPLYFQRIKGYN